MNRDKVFEDLIQTIERNAVNNVTTISNVDLWAKSWREELRQYLVSSSFSSENDHICMMYLDKQKTCMVCGKKNCC